jgi:7-carboxy-7-deazaguanine synthase
LPPPEDIVFNSNMMQRRGAYIVCSPKAGKVNPRTAQLACCFKYVLRYDSVSQTDGLPIEALGHTASPVVARPPADFLLPVYVQPMDAQDSWENELNIQAAKASCMKHGYILQLQIHKLIGVE